MPIKLDLTTIDFVSATLKKEKVFTLQELTSLLNCSRRTAQTMLSRWKTFTSYNHNSKYYSFPEIPKFNIHGLWCYKSIAFSENGTLKKTIIHLVNSSEAGLTENELGALPGIPPQNFDHHFKDCPGLYREKHGGVYIHFSDQAVNAQCGTGFLKLPLLESFPVLHKQRSHPSGSGIIWTK